MAQKVVKSKSRRKGEWAPRAGARELLDKVNAQQPYNKLSPFRSGDTVKVHVWIAEGEKKRIQIYEGTVISLKGTGLGKNLTVRKISHGVGVERIFNLQSPKVSKVEVVSPGRTRRAKLYYLRELEGKKAKLDRLDETSGPARAVVN